MFHLSSCLGLSFSSGCTMDGLVRIRTCQKVRCPAACFDKHLLILKWLALRDMKIKRGLSLVLSKNLAGHVPLLPPVPTPYTQYMIMIYPQPVRRHYHLKYILITLAPVSYLRSLVVRAEHLHRTAVSSIPAGGPYS